MTSEQAQAFLKVIQAFADGEEAQWQNSVGNWNTIHRLQLGKSEFNGIPIARWRVEPIQATYRLFVNKVSGAAPFVDTAINEATAAIVEQGVKDGTHVWLSDWITVEVPR